MIYDDYFKEKAGQILLFIVKATPIVYHNPSTPKKFVLIISKFENARNRDYIIPLLSKQQKLAISKRDEIYIESAYNWLYDERIKKKNIDCHNLGTCWRRDVLYELIIQLFIPRFQICKFKEDNAFGTSSNKNIKLSHSNGKCSYVNCDEPAIIDGLCWKHYHMERTTK